MSIEKGSNLTSKEINGIADDFVVYPSGYYRRILPGQNPRSLKGIGTINPQELDDGDFVIPKHSETPLMSRVREANNGKTIGDILRRIFTNPAEGHTFREAEKELGTSVSTLYSWVKKLGIENKRSRHSLKKDTRLLREVKRNMKDGETYAETLERLYKSASLRELAKLLHVTAPAVEDAMIKLGIPRREPHRTTISSKSK